MKKNWINPELKSLEIGLTEAGSIQAEQVSVSTLDINTGDGSSVLFYWWCTCCGTKSTGSGDIPNLNWGTTVWGTAKEAIDDGNAKHGNCGACSA